VNTLDYEYICFVIEKLTVGDLLAIWLQFLLNTDRNSVCVLFYLSKCGSVRKEESLT